MTDSFYATIKITTGEEVLSEIMPTEENGEKFFVLHNPIVIHESTQVDSEKGVVMSGLIPKKWMLFQNEDMSILYPNHVISMSELDKFGVDFYRKALIAAKMASPIKRKVESDKNTGFVGKIEALRDSLEDMFDSSPDLG
jgi:hypothetical protein